MRDHDSRGWGNLHREESTESWTHKVKSGVGQYGIVRVVGGGTYMVRKVGNGKQRR